MRRPARPMAAAGRVVLWAFVALVLVRGLGAIFSGPSSVDRDAGGAGRGESSLGVEARSFAVRFASAYLSFNPKQPEAHRRAVTAFLADDLRDQAAATTPPRRSGRIVWASVAREAPLRRSRVLITVATASAEGSVRYLSVPVARDRDGGLIVFDLPSLSAPPAKGTASVPESVALSGADARPVEDLVKRFLTTYLAGGDRGALVYFLAPDVRLVRMPAGLEVEGVDQVTRDTAAPGGRLAVIASVRVRDRASGAVLALRYRLSLVRRERWYVHAVAGGPSA